MSTIEMQARGLRRRLITLSLGLAPGDLRRSAKVRSAAKVSQVLGGAARFSPNEAASFARLAGRRLRQLFAE